VVLPTPPFWLAIVMMRQWPGRGHGWPSPAPRTPTAASAARAIGVSCGFCGTSGITIPLALPSFWAVAPLGMASSTPFPALPLSWEPLAVEAAVSRETAADKARPIRSGLGWAGSAAPFSRPVLRSDAAWAAVPDAGPDTVFSAGPGPGAWG